MLTQILAGLVVLLVVAFLRSITDPDKASKWGAILLRRIRWTSGFIQRKYTALKVESDANHFFRDRVFGRIGGDPGLRLKIRWVKDTDDPIWTKDGVVILRMRRDADQTKNTIAAVSSAVRVAIFPHARPYLKPEFTDAIDLQIVRKLADLLGPHAQSVFATHVLAPQIQSNPNLRELLGRLHQVDRAGLFEAVLLQELVFLGEAARIEPPDPVRLHNETREFVALLHWLATREPGDESRPLLFVRDYFKVGFILMSKAATAARGMFPYVRRLGIHLATGARSVYLLELIEGRSDLFHEVIEEVRADRRVEEEKVLTLLVRQGTKTVDLSLALFRRNDLYMTDASFADHIWQLGISEGSSVTGIVRGIRGRQAVIEAEGFAAIAKSRDLAWGYKGSAGQLLSAGEDYEFRVVSVDAENCQLLLGIKEKTDPPWTDGSAPLPGSRVRVLIEEIGTLGIIVRFHERERTLYGRIPHNEWSWHAEGSSAYERPEVGQVIEAEVKALSPEQEDIILSRRGVESIAWEEVAKRYPKGTPIRVTVLATDLSGIVCELEPGITGRISDYELRNAGYELADWTETVVPGQKLDASIKHIKHRKRRFSLCLERNLQRA